MEARNERGLLMLQRDRQAVKLLVVAELGYGPLSPTRAEQAPLSDRAKSAQFVGSGLRHAKLPRHHHYGKGPEHDVGPSLVAVADEWA